MLGDTASLAGSNSGLSDGIKNGSFTMVNVTHDADNRRTGNHVFLVLFLFLEHLFDDINDNLMLAKDIVLKGDLLCLFIGNI